MKLKTSKGYLRHPNSLYCVFARLGYTKLTIKATNKYRLQIYHTPENIGIKWQMDVKYVPKLRYVGKFKNSFFQYRIINEASRERFIYLYQECSSYSTVDFVKRAIHYLSILPKLYKPTMVLSLLFISHKEYGRIHLLKKLCDSLKIEHKLISPRTPRHNGKVERSHRLDQERFYNHLKFYSYKDLKVQIGRYLAQYKIPPNPVLNWLTHLRKKAQIVGQFHDTKLAF